MNAGQIVAAMSSGTTSAVLNTPAAPVPVDANSGETFSGVLEEISAQNSVAGTPAAESAKMVSTAVLEMKRTNAGSNEAVNRKEVMPEIVASLLAAVGAAERAQSSVIGADVKSDDVPEEQQEKGGKVPQNLEMSVAGAQVVQSPQFIGRMPAPEHNSAQEDDRKSVASITAARPTQQSEISLHQKPEVDGKTALSNQMPQDVGSNDAAGSFPIQGRMPALEQTSVTQEIIPEHMETVLAPKQTGQASQTKKAENTSLPEEELNDFLSPGIEKSQKVEFSAPKATQQQTQSTQFLQSRMVAPLKTAVVPAENVAKASIATPQQSVELQSAPFSTKPAVPVEVLDKIVGEQAQPVVRQAEQKTAVPVVQITALSQDKVPELSVGSAVEADKRGPATGFRFSHPVAVDVALGDGQQVSPRSIDKIEAPLANNARVAISQQPETLSAGSGESEFSFTEREFTGFMQQNQETQHPATQHVSTAHQPFAVGSSAPVQLQSVPPEPSRLDVHENVALQVHERLSTHEVKAGSDQIVFRLSPENMGEIKVHLRLDDQRLKVEIVAENRVAREGLLQHMDSLKESLSRQNISMDKFTVTSGESHANSQGGNNPQGEWRELARNRQSQQWLNSGGYRIPTDELLPPRPVYQSKTEHAMLDLHF